MKWKDDLLNEIKFGGKEAPCPFCKKPRVRRSTYIRCSSCGINWNDGEILDRDPSIQRKEELLAALAATKTKSTSGRKDDDNHGNRNGPAPAAKIGPAPERAGAGAAWPVRRG